MNRAKAEVLLQMGRRLVSRRQVRRLASYGKYRLLMPITRRWGPDRQAFNPPNVIIAVTARCNRQCDFCYFAGELNPHDAGRLELDHETFLRLMELPVIRHGLRIAFTGGEPLLNKDLFRMTAEARRRGFIVSIVTNGLLLEERLSELLGAPPDLLAVSYYPDARLPLLETLGKIPGSVFVKLNFVLSPERLKHLEDLFLLAVSAGVRLVDVEHVHPPADDSKICATPPVFNGREYENHRARIQAEYGKKVQISWGPEPGSRRLNRATGCRVFWHSIHIDALGRLSPCCQWPLRTYRESLFNDPEAWNSREMKVLRNRMRRNEAPGACVSCPQIHEDYLGI